MFAGNVASSNSPYSTKSTLQALLRTRRQLLNEQEKSTINNCDEEKLMQGSLSIDGKHIVHFGTNRTTNDDSAFPNLKDIDPNGDFTYSQKLFHIADGNLYSIFSPLQGRSYGMKPSFLRKQKCTVQECRGRGRKVLRKGLKFHNFLPSESVTSEKGSTLLDDQWKVHSECKLREEHGTKQITVSNWFHSVKQPVDEEYKQKETSLQDLLCLKDGEVIMSEDDLCEKKNGYSSYGENVKALNNSIGRAACASATSDTVTSSCASATSDTVTSSNQASVFKYPSVPPVRSSSKLHNEKSNFLNNLLSSVTNSKVTEVSSPKTDHEIRHRIIDCDGQKRRRKPEQTRRVVPYNKYLSLMEETETGPLDLSLHSNSVCNQISLVDNFHCDSGELSNNFKRHTNNHVTLPQPSFPNTYKTSLQYSVSNKQVPHTERHDPKEMDDSGYRHVAKLCYSNPPGSYYPIPFKENSRVTHPAVTMSDSSPLEQPPTTNHYAPNSLTHSSFKPNTRQEPILKYVPIAPTPPNGAKYCANSKSLVHIKPRKKSQRSVIKQKLEDTFKQNGFLVKTKQVSDGEATFCKFRQLRKYTRYYLKSWQQHLPDEVHKMWKGFLPPKTVLPSISGMISNTSEETT